MKYLGALFGLVGLVFFSPSLLAADDNERYEVSREVVERTMADLVQLMREVDIPDDEDKAKELQRGLIEQNLDPVVDFQRIVKLIMGKYFAKATKEQRNKFLDAFRLSLVNSYGKYLMNSNLEELANKIQYKVLPLGRQLRPGRSSVNTLISIEGDPVQITFSLYYNPKKEQWLMENMIVEGINLGINYRAQFDRMMVSYNGDYDQVIEQWAVSDSEVAAQNN